MDEQSLMTASIEELFQDYIKMYGPKLESPRYEQLVSALRDAFFAGIATAIVSDRDFAMEILVYIRHQKDSNTNKEGWIH